MSNSEQKQTEDDQQTFIVEAMHGIAELVGGGLPPSVELGVDKKKMPADRWRVVILIVFSCLVLGLWAYLLLYANEGLSNTPVVAESTATSQVAVAPREFSSEVRVASESEPMKIVLDTVPDEDSSAQTPAVVSSVTAQIIGPAPQTIVAEPVPQIAQSVPAPAVQTRIWQLIKPEHTARMVIPTQTAPQLSKPTVQTAPALPSADEVAGLLAATDNLDIQLSGVAGYDQPRQWWCGFTPFTDRICDANPLIPYWWHGHLKVLLGQIVPRHITISTAETLIAVSKPTLSSLEIDANMDNLLVPLTAEGTVAKPIIDSQGRESIEPFVSATAVSMDEAAETVRSSACADPSIIKIVSQRIYDSLAARLSLLENLPSLRIVYIDESKRVLSILDLCSS